MKKVTDYRLFGAQDSLGLVAIVMAKIADGWQPLGAPFVPTGSPFVQAMVRYEE